MESCFTLFLSTFDKFAPNRGSVLLTLHCDLIRCIIDKINTIHEQCTAEIPETCCKSSYFDAVCIPMHFPINIILRLWCITYHTNHTLRLFSECRLTWEYSYMYVQSFLLNYLTNRFQYFHTTWPCILIDNSGELKIKIKTFAQTVVTQ